MKKIFALATVFIALGLTSCKKDEPSHTKKRLSVDHDHSCCGQGRGCNKCVRMLLCSQCNMSLGAVKDNIKVLKSMIKYLEEYS